MELEESYQCRTCQHPVRPPSQMGRSWCEFCEAYEIPEETPSDQPEELPSQPPETLEL